MGGKSHRLRQGKGGRNIVSMKLGILGRSGMQGGHFALFAGAAKSVQMRGGGQAAICSFGEGAATSGLLHESLNQAAIWKLPLIYQCEVNHFQGALRTEFVWAQPDLSKMAIPYNIPSAIVDGNDAIAVAEAAQLALNHARSGQGPYFLELKTYRMRGQTENEDPETWHTAGTWPANGWGQ